MDSYRSQRLIAVVEKGGDMAAVDGNWANGIQIWNFGVPEDRHSGTTRIRGLIQSDRGIYRPGETVHFKGLVREVAVGRAPAVPTGAPMAGDGDRQPRHQALRQEAAGDPLRWLLVRPADRRGGGDRRLLGPGPGQGPGLPRELPGGGVPQGDVRGGREDAGPSRNARRQAHLPGRGRLPVRRAGQGRQGDLGGAAPAPHHQCAGLPGLRLRRLRRARRRVLVVGRGGRERVAVVRLRR